MKNKMEVKGNIYCYGIYCMKEQGEKGKVLYVGSGEINDCLSRHLHYLKRGLYEGTNKDILQKKYDGGVLEFEVLHESESKQNYNNMSLDQKESLQEAMSTLEEFYITLYKDSICNKHMKVTRHSSNKNRRSTYKRRCSNLGSNNPNQKYTEGQICNILYLKEYGFKNKEIKEIIEKECNIDISASYIWAIGNTKWIHINSKFADWMDRYIKEKDTIAANNNILTDTDTANICNEII